jgi:hypothetical protein
VPCYNFGVSDLLSAIIYAVLLDLTIYRASRFSEQLLNYWQQKTAVKREPHLSDIQGSLHRCNWSKQANLGCQNPFHPHNTRESQLGRKFKVRRGLIENNFILGWKFKSIVWVEILKHFTWIFGLEIVRIYADSNAKMVDLSHILQC